MEEGIAKISRIKPRVTISADQKQIIVRAMESDKELYNANCNTADGRMAYKIKWDRLTRTLNVIQGGCKKNNRGWQKSWAAMKHQLKISSAEAGHRTYSKLERRIAQLMDLDVPNRSEIKHVNGCANPTYADHFEYNIVKFEHPSTSMFSSTSTANNPKNDTDEDIDDTQPNQQSDDSDERIELKTVDDDQEDDYHSKQTIANFKTDEAIDLIANLLERQTAAIERQTEAIIKKPTPPTPTSNINAAINVIGQILERQTQAIERQTVVIEKQDKTTLVRRKSNLEADGDQMSVIVGLLERQTKATEKLTESVEKQMETIEKFQVLMKKLLQNLSVVVHER